MLFRANLLQIHLHHHTRVASFRTFATMETVQKLVGKEEDKRTAHERFLASVDATKVHYKRLGKSGLKVSVPIFGAMSFGSDQWADWVKNEDEALPLLKAAYDRGLNTWDTANVYSNGVSEEIIGKALKKYNIPRQKVVILTKCFFTVGEEPGFSGIKAGDQMVKSKDYYQSGGLSRGSIFNAVEASLKRLDTTYIDLLQIHRFDPNTPIEETMKALHDIVQTGKVRYIGASSMFAWQFATMQFTAEKHGWTKFISMQNHYSLLYREEEREMIPFCNETGVGLIPWGPLGAGKLARPLKDHGSTLRSAAAVKTQTLRKEDEDTINLVEKIAAEKGWTMSQVATAWINKRVTSPIVGFSSIARIDELCEIEGKTLTDEEDKALSEIYNPKVIMGHS
jgi:aryl-alcohol dehydrogenase-like predicted oxidoreductase